MVNIKIAGFTPVEEGLSLLRISAITGKLVKEFSIFRGSPSVDWNISDHFAISFTTRVYIFNFQHYPENGKHGCYCFSKCIK